MIPKKNNVPRAHPNLGALTAEKFLREYWQKKPLLIRNAFPHFQQPLNKRDVLALAAREDAESRLIARRGHAWEVTHGPIGARERKRASDALWTVLVQDTQHFSPVAHDVLAAFNFIPHARVDDLMVSYAIPGAGVGPHVDSYDVFLIQGMGQRRWRLSAQHDLRLRADLPLKMLAHFKPEVEYVLNTGDMLYLPPNVAHDGVAETECQTWSVGFRAPSQQELSAAMLDYLRDDLTLEGRYTDPELRATRRPGEIDTAMSKRFRDMLRETQQATRDPIRVARCIGRTLTEPKAHVVFYPPDAPLGLAAFRRRACLDGLVLSLQSRLLYDQHAFYLNGECWCEMTTASGLCQFADNRRIGGGQLAEQISRTDPLWTLLHEAYEDGYLVIGQ